MASNEIKIPIGLDASSVQRDLKSISADINKSVNSFFTINKDRGFQRDIGILEKNLDKLFNKDISYKSFEEFIKGVNLSDVGKYISEESKSVSEVRKYITELELIRKDLIDNIKAEAEQIKASEGLRVYSQDIVKNGRVIHEKGSLYTGKSTKDLPYLERASLSSEARVEVLKQDLIELTNFLSDVRTTYKDISSKLKLESKYHDDSIRALKAGEKETKISERDKTAILHSANLYRLSASITLFNKIITAGVNGVKKLTSALQEANTEMQKFNLVFGETNDIASQFDNSISATVELVSNLTGISSLTVKTMANEFYSVGRSIGITSDKVKELESVYLETASEISKRKNIDLQTVAKDLLSTLQSGQATGILSFLNIDEKTLRNYAKTKGIIKSETDEMSKQLQFATALSLIQEKSFDITDETRNASAEYLMNVSALKSQTKELTEILADDFAPVFNVITKGILKTVTSLSSSFERLPKWFTTTTSSLVSIVAIGLGIVSFTKLIEVGLKKINILIAETFQASSKVSLTFSKIARNASLIGGFITMFSGMFLILANAISMSKSKLDDFSETFEDIGNNTNSANESMEDYESTIKKVKGSLMGFDKLNILSQKETGLDKGTFSSLFSDSAIKDETENINKYTEAIKKAEKSANDWTLAIGIVTTVLGALRVVLAKVNAQKSISNAKDATSIGLSIGKRNALLAETVATNANTVALNAQNTALSLRNILLGGLIGGVIVAGAWALSSALSASNKQTKSANGNFFPRASTTIIGEKYPEVAIPLGSSPQYAEMKTSIARQVVEMLGETSVNGGDIRIVNQTVLDGRVIDERIKKVSREDYRSQTGRTYNQVASRV